MPSSVYGQLSLASSEAPVIPWLFLINGESNIKVKYWQQFPLGSEMYMFYWIQKWPFSSKQWLNCRTLQKSIPSTPNLSCISERYTIPCQVHYYPFKCWMVCISYCSIRNEGSRLSGPLGRCFTGWIAFIFPFALFLNFLNLASDGSHFNLIVSSQCNLIVGDSSEIDHSNKQYGQRGKARQQ